MYYNSLDEEGKKNYLRVKRAAQIVDTGGAQNVLDATGEGFAQSFPKTPKITETPEYMAAQEGAKTQAQLDAELAKKPGVIIATKGAENQAEINAAQPKALANVNSVKNKVLGIVDTITQARGDIAKPGTEGFVAQQTQDNAAFPAFSLKEKLGTIKANLGFSELQAMRDASPTGGALGQVAVQEIEALQATIASLKLGQSDEQLLKNLTKIEGHLNNWAKAVQDSYDTAYGGTDPQATGNRIPNPGGVVDVLSQDDAFKYEAGTRVRLNGQVFEVQD
jgi:hypothetical protein